MERKYKCKYCGMDLANSRTCAGCSRKLALVRELIKICDQIKAASKPKPKLIELDTLNEALTKAYRTNFDDGRIQFASGLLFAKDIVNSLPTVSGSRADNE